MITALVTGINGSVAAQFAQSLKYAGYRVLGVDIDPLGRLLYPPHPADQCLLVRAPENDQQLVDDLAAVVRAESIDVIVATGMSVIRAFAAVGNPTSAKLLIPDLGVIDVCHSKWHTYRGLAGHVPVADTLLLSRRDDLAVAEDRFGLPLWIRSACGQAGPTAFRAEDVNDGELWITLKRGWGSFLASPYLPGANLATTMLFDRSGRLVAVTVHERVAYMQSACTPSGVTGLASASVTRHRSDAAEIGERAVRRVCEVAGSGPSGIFTVDSKGDRQDAPHVTEINARPTNTWLLTQAGVNFADLLVRLAMEENVPTLPRNAYRSDMMCLRKVDFPCCHVPTSELLKPMAPVRRPPAVQ